MSSFKHLGLSSQILKVLKELEFSKPTEIQLEAIPQLILGDKDFIGLAQTGTGKTAAFGLPLLERIDLSKNATQALVLAPTRELGRQIADQLVKFGKYIGPVKITAVYGGTPIAKQIKAVKKSPDIIIATPGRLIDLIGRKAVSLQQLEYLILDEADEMLNMGFKEDIDKILKFTGQEKLTWLFSATMPKEIRQIVNEYMDDPIEVRVNSKNLVNQQIEHQFATLRHADKTEALCRFIDSDENLRALIFCRTRRNTQDLADSLSGKGYKVEALHGDLSQAQRNRVMKRFKDKSLRLVVATDVAARGIDVDDLSHIFHYHLPDDSSYYTHRSGRTARGGKNGISMAFINNREGYRLERLEKQLKIKFNQIEIPDMKEVSNKRLIRQCQDIANLKSKRHLDPNVINQVEEIFEYMDKEELIFHLLQYSLAQSGKNDGTDLNQTLEGGRSNSSKRSPRNNQRRFEKRSKHSRNKSKKEGRRSRKRW